MEFDDRTPIYTQIMDLIKRSIAAGELKTGQQLPSVREQAQQLVVNPNTVQKAYLELEREGYVATQRGMGTFVTGDRNAVDQLRERLAADIVQTYVAHMRSLGFDERDMTDMVAGAAKEEPK
ncbi:MAG: GntR family transcriptional regulator [Candidatus Cryosericum sp.]